MYRIPLSKFQPRVRLRKISATIKRLALALPGADVRPVRQIVEGETRVLGKMRSTLLAAALLIILTAAVCVLSTLTDGFPTAAATLP